MTSFSSPRHPILAIGFCSLVFASLASAGHAPDPSHLPSCHAAAPTDACRLPVKDGGFDSLDGWLREGLPSLGYEASGNSYVALHVGAVVSQAVYAHFGTLPRQAAYVLRFKVRTDRGAAHVRASIALSDQSGEHTRPLGETTTIAHAGEWRTMELMVNGADFAAPAHIMLKIANEAGDYLQLDDVYLVQADGVDIASVSQESPLPTCTSSVTSASTAACQLFIENPGFDADGVFLSWTTNPLKPNAVRRVDDDGSKLAFAPGGSVFQIVPLPDRVQDGDNRPYFLPALSARSTQGEVRLRMKIQLIDAAGARTVFSHDYSVGETWSRPSDGFDVGEVSPSAALAVHISRIDNRPEALLQVDDVRIARMP